MSTDYKPTLKTGELTIVEGLSPLPVGQLDPLRPKWMDEEAATQALAMADNLVTEVKTSPADIRLMLRVGKLGNDGVERIAPNVALYNKHVNQMVTESQTGSPANLTLADTNEEAANLLALQTRQQLSSTALSMASQADQAVLRLF